MLKLTRENRVLNAMQIKLLQEYFKRRGEDINLSKIQDEVEEFVK